MLITVPAHTMLLAIAIVNGYECLEIFNLNELWEASLLSQQLRIAFLFYA